MELKKPLTEEQLLEAANLFGSLSHMGDYPKREAMKELLSDKWNQQTTVSGAEWFKLFKYLTDIGRFKYKALGGSINPKKIIMNEWKQYKRKGLSEMRPYVPGEDLTGISVAEVDTPELGRHDCP
jgi:hypothetical protein